MELSYPRTFVPGNESSIGGTFVPWNFRLLFVYALELLIPGKFISREGNKFPGTRSGLDRVPSYRPT